MRMSVNGGWIDTSTASKSSGVELVDQLLDELRRLEVVEVHLPVAADERLARLSHRRPHGPPLQTVMIGSPVGLTRRAGPRGRAGHPAPAARATRRRRSTRGRPRRRGRTAASAAALSPPPTTVNAAGVGDRLGDGPGAGLEPRVLEHAHGPVPEHGAGLGDAVAEVGGRPRPMSTPVQPVGHRGADLADVAAGVGVDQLAAGPERGDVGRQHQAVAVLVEQARGRCRPCRPRAG